MDEISKVTSAPRHSGLQGPHDPCDDNTRAATPPASTAPIISIHALLFQMPGFSEPFVATVAAIKPQVQLVCFALVQKSATRATANPPPGIQAWKQLCRSQGHLPHRAPPQQTRMKCPSCAVSCVGHELWQHPCRRHLLVTPHSVRSSSCLPLYVFGQIFEVSLLQSPPFST
jgi:hypothetical protein